jgi:hypothetical protein
MIIGQWGRWVFVLFSAERPEAWISLFSRVKMEPRLDRSQGVCFFFLLICAGFDMQDLRTCAF